ncbi:MAG: hypothetical protein IH951_12040 [Bacteroidetes bacterium]|nr:hypothetical protein [Bacteroidota bacterium]
MSSDRKIILCLICFGWISSVSSGQSSHPLPVENGIYVAIQRLQNRGYLLELNPTALPYTEDEVRAALASLSAPDLDKAERVWLRQIEGRLSRVVPARHESIVGVRLLPGIRATNNGRLDALRYRSGADNHVFQNILLQFRFASNRIASALAVRHDLYYDRDPDGLDTVLRWMSRTEDSYLRFEGKIFGLVIGRFSRHWGLYGQPSTMLSSNPRSYDQLGFRIGGSRLSIRSILGELDSITTDGRFTGVAGDDSVKVGSERRYVAYHRLDWRPTRNFVVTFMQSTLYSGANSGLSLKYLNPFHSVIFALDSLPKNDENNGIVGMGLWYRSSKAVFHFQGILDDVDVLNLSEPISFAITGSVTFPRVASLLDLTFGGEAIASRTYNTIQPEGRYIYLLRGLAAQFSDYIAINAQVDYHAFSWAPGLLLSPRIDVLWQGERDIRQAYPTNDDDIKTILTGTIERTIRAALRMRYEPTEWMFISVDAGINNLTNAFNVAGKSLMKIIGVVEVGLTLSIDRAFNMEFL